MLRNAETKRASLTNDTTHRKFRRVRSPNQLKNHGAHPLTAAGGRRHRIAATMDLGAMGLQLNHSLHNRCVMGVMLAAAMPESGQWLQVHQRRNSPGLAQLGRLHYSADRSLGSLTGLQGHPLVRRPMEPGEIQGSPWPGGNGNNSSKRNINSEHGEHSRWVAGIRGMVPQQSGGKKRKTAEVKMLKISHGDHGGGSKPKSPQNAKEQPKDRLTMLQAAEKAKSGSWRKKAIANLREKMFAKSTNATKEVKRRKILKILQEVAPEKDIFPLSCQTLTELGAVLGECRLKAGDQYIGEVKLLQLELGHSWSDVLERQLQVIKRALRRDSEKRAKEVKIEDAQNLWDAETGGRKEGPEFPGLSYLFACIWMLRSGEVTEVKVNNLKFDQDRRSVTLALDKSKTDQAGLGVRRTLKCCGKTPCEAICPWNICHSLVKKQSDQRKLNGCLISDHKRQRISRQSLVKAWCERIDPEMSGHSARRSGAMHYARKGMSISELAFLARRKSAAVFRYVEEALMEIPANESIIRGQNASLENGGHQKDSVETKPPAIAPAPRRDIPESQASRDEKPDKTLTTTQAEDLEEPERKPLWAISFSRGNKMAHRVQKASWGLPLEDWATVCGWKFAASAARVELTRVKPFSAKCCAKCSTSHLVRDKVSGGHGLAQYIKIWMVPNLTKHRKFKCRVQMYQSDLLRLSAKSPPMCIGRVGGVIPWVSCWMFEWVWKNHQTWKAVEWKNREDGPPGSWPFWLKVVLLHTFVLVEVFLPTLPHLRAWFGAVH